MMLASGLAHAQSEDIEALKELIAQKEGDSPTVILALAQQGRDLAVEQRDLESMAWFLSQMANANLRLSKYTDALDQYHEATLIYEDMGLKEPLSYVYNNMANVHRETGNNELAYDYYNTALDLFIELDDSAGIAISYNNIGIIHMMAAEYELGMEMWQRSLDVKLGMGNELGAASTMNNMAMYYRDIGETEKALDFLSSVMEIETKHKDYHGMSLCADNIGELYMKQGDSALSFEYYKLGLEYAQQSESVMTQASAWLSLADVNYFFGEYQRAYDALEMHYYMRDSILGLDRQEQLDELEAVYGNEKKALEIENLEAEKERQNLQNLALAIGLGLMAILAIVILRGYRQKKKSHDIIAKQKEEVEHQHDLIEEKNKEILDSINYAKRLQEAILPSDERVKTELPDSFIYYVPKDIVAGDFYWMETRDDMLVFAAADCTGHGVPGAMVSVVCANALERSVMEFGLTEPAAILDKTRDIVIGHFSKSGDEVKDGMDIALCAMEMRSVNRNPTKLKFAGANNPLVIIRNGEVIEIKADKQPIGRYAMASPFTGHEVDIQKGDVLYIFSDGFIDQFGGDKMKKLKYKPFKELLVSIAGMQMNQQRVELGRFFNQWKGELEQLDDVIVIGVRIS